MKIEHKSEQQGKGKKHWIFDMPPRETIAIFTIVVGLIVKAIIYTIHH